VHNNVIATLFLLPSLIAIPSTASATTTMSTPMLLYPLVGSLDAPHSWLWIMQQWNKPLQSVEETKMTIVMGMPPILLQDDERKQSIEHTNWLQHQEPRSQAIHLWWKWVQGW
jgi:hypothetical protein